MYAALQNIAAIIRQIEAEEIVPKNQQAVVAWVEQYLGQSLIISKHVLVALVEALIQNDDSIASFDIDGHNVFR